MLQDRNDPFAQFNFIVELDGIDVAGFTEVGGIAAESDIVEYREGADLPTVRKLPGLLTYANITLKKGYTLNLDLWDWRKTTLDGSTDRRGGAIVLMNEAREPVLRWNFVNGWVSKYEGPALNSTASEAAIESIEITHEGVVLVPA